MLFRRRQPSRALKSPTSARGDQFETHALNYLQQQGLGLIERNVRYRNGEIDLVMLDSSTSPNAYIFVEVRKRVNQQYGGALASITPQKQQRLRNAALQWLQKQDPSATHSCRFDALCFEGRDGVEEVIWIKGAFDG